MCLWSKQLARWDSMPSVHVRHPRDLEEDSVHLHASHVAPTSGHRARTAAQ